MRACQCRECSESDSVGKHSSSRAQRNFYFPQCHELFIRKHLLTTTAIGMALAASVRAADLKPTKATVLARENTLVIERALIGDGELLVPVENVEAITGFEIKPEGMCVDDLCIPIPTDSGW